MTPDQIKLLFDGNWIIIAFAIGIVWKYLPALKNATNDLIPWINAAAYILAKLAGIGTAEAAGFEPGAITDAVGTLIGGFTSAAWAKILYDGFFKSAIEKWLRIKPPKPTAPRPA